MSFRLENKTETCNFALCNFGPAIAKDMQLTKCSVQVFSQLYNHPMLSIDHIRASPYDEQVSKYHFESTHPHDQCLETPDSSIDKMQNSCTSIFLLVHTVVQVQRLCKQGRVGWMKWQFGNLPGGGLTCKVV